uniref:THAP domain-containing protein 1 n=1 Tax=Gouania willdenowi TaxID=441366 RepID=A0A8C5EFL5_GOUWI
RPDWEWCKVNGCYNNKRKNPHKHFFSVPKPNTDAKAELAKRWLHIIGTKYTFETFPFGRNSVVCEDHFTPSCYERDLRNELMGSRPKRRLKPDAVPTEFHQRKSLDGRRQGGSVTKTNQSTVIIQ